MDPIVPRNQGGSDDLSNLKALCFRRNAGKRDGCLPTQEGSTDFRSLQSSYAHRQDSCVFCALEAEVGAAGERNGAVHRRCRSGDAWPQPGDPVACPSVVRNPNRGCCLAGRPKPRSSTRSGAIEKPAAHVLVKDTADQGLVGNALLQGTGTQGA